MLNQAFQSTFGEREASAFLSILLYVSVRSRLLTRSQWFLASTVSTRHHLGRFGLRLGNAGELEHFLDVSEEFFSNGLELIVAIIGLVRQREPALVQVEDVLV